MRSRIKFLELHESIFIGSKNHPAKIDAQKGELAITHYVEGVRNEIHIVSRDGIATIIPFSMVKQAQPFYPKECGMEVEGLFAEVSPPTPAHPPVINGKVKAQVSAPAGIRID